MDEIRNEFSWSKSRDALFRECLRAYYYNHYGSWGGWRDDAPEEVRELYVMKNLSSRPAWRGIMVHEVAERAVKALLAGRRWPLERALEEAEARMRTEAQVSAEGRYRRGVWLDWGDQRVKVNGLLEHYYGEAFGEEELRQDVNTVLACIRTLYRSPAFNRLVELGTDGILSVEELGSFLVDDIKVWVKLDVCVRGRDKKLVIIDWKTGTSHRQDDIALQLGIYGLFGSQHWEVAPDQILGYDVNLRLATTHTHTIDSATLEKVAAYIRESAVQMRARLKDPEANLADVEDFPMTTLDSRCRWCRFRRACRRG